jgi:hypothetical protein
MILLDRMVRMAQLKREVCEQLIVRGKLSLHRVIRHPFAAAQRRDHMIEHRIKVHHRPSTCASVASAWGSHKVISMARYHSMAADNSACACSRRPIFV